MFSFSVDFFFILAATMRVKHVTARRGVVVVSTLDVRSESRWIDSWLLPLHPPHIFEGEGKGGGGGYPSMH